MSVLIRIFARGIAVQVGNGSILWFDDWVQAFEVIRPEDTVTVEVWTR